MAFFTAGTALTAAKLNAINGYVIKTADQSVTSSTTLVNDTHLSFAIPASGTYIVDAWLYGVSAANAAGDLAVGFSFPAGTFHAGGAGGPDINLASNSIEPGEWLAALSVASGTGVVAFGLSTTVTQSHVHGILIATAAGTLQLMWAQYGSNASASTLKAGSHMRVDQVA